MKGFLSFFSIFAFCWILSTDAIAFGTDEYYLRRVRAAPSSNNFRRWPNKTVYYQIDPELLSVKASIESAFKAVERVSCIRYIPRTDQIDFVTFVHNTTRCYEPVGKQGGSQSIFINIPSCGNFGFYLHASMQVLGFYHEHQRFDRDQYVTIFPENADPEWLWAFEKLNATDHYYNSTYDTESIMHYGSFQFSINRKPTVLTEDGGFIEGWVEKAKLSALDVEALNKIYDCNGQNSGGLISKISIVVNLCLFFLVTNLEIQ